MIRIDRERLIEAGGARVDHRLTKAKRVVLSGQVDEMMPDQGMSNTHTVFIDNSESVLNLNARLVEGEYEAFAQRVPDNCVELMIDDDGWLSGAINRGYITPEIWQCVVLEKLAADGFAVIGPIEKAVVVGLMTWLNRMLARGLRFYYDIETVNGQYKDFRLVVWRDGQIGVGEKGILAVNYSQTDAPKIESMFGGGGDFGRFIEVTSCG